jgi:IclR family pca regulon transcriptional regulator
MNVTVHAAETSVEHLVGEHLPLLLRAAGTISAEWAQLRDRPLARGWVDPGSSATA